MKKLVEDLGIAIWTDRALHGSRRPPEERPPDSRRVKDVVADLMIRKIDVNFVQKKQSAPEDRNCAKVVAMFSDRQNVLTDDDKEDGQICRNHRRDHCPTSVVVDGLTSPSTVPASRPAPPALKRLRV